MTTWHPLPLSEAYRSVARGHGLWIAFGTFLDDWRYLATHDPSALAELIREPIDGGEASPREAAFFQAVAEHLVVHSVVPIEYPPWIVRPRWILKDPWFLYPGFRLRAWQLVTTPAAFKARNIFVGDRVFERV